MKVRWITRSLLGLGLASLFSDFSHEMITAVLPAFLASIGAGAAALGIIEGAADALSSFVKLYSGWLGDRPGKKRALIAAGYAITGISLPFVAFSGRVWQVLLLRIVAWSARGFRSPLRDVVLVESVERRYATRAFGFHRSMDTLGAALGPLAALIALFLHRSPATIIFVAIVPGILSPLAMLLVRERGVLKERQTLRVTISAIPRSFRVFLGAVGIFGVGNFSHTLLILLATAVLAPHFGAVAATIAVGLYMLHNVIFAGLAYPMGRLGERIGPARLLGVGYALFVVLCALAAWQSRSVVALVAIFVIAGVYIAIVEPMEPSTATELLPQRARGLGFGVLASTNGIGDFISSAGVGLLWARFGTGVAFGAAGVAAAVGMLLLIPTVLRPRIDTASKPVA